MTLSKFSVFNIQINLCKFEEKSGCPVYAIKVYKGFPKENSFEHHSISYTRDQAFIIYRHMIVYLHNRYLILS